MQKIFGKRVHRIRQIIKNKQKKIHLKKIKTKWTETSEEFYDCSQAKTKVGANPCNEKV